MPDKDFKKHYELEERLAVITIPDNSFLEGKTLDQSRFGQALGTNILNINRKSGVNLVPKSNLQLQAGDKLLVLGRLDAIDELYGNPIEILDDRLEASCLLTDEVGLAELVVDGNSIFNNKTPFQLNARQTWGINILAVKKEGQLRRTNLRDTVFKTDDRILIQGPKERLNSFREHRGFRYLQLSETSDYDLNERLLKIKIPKNSPFAGKSIKKVHLSTAYGITIISIIRDNEQLLMPDPDTVLLENDLIIVEGRPVDLEVLRSHQNLIIDRNPEIDLKDLEANDFAIVEVMLSPYATQTGKTLRQLDFREKFGVSV